MTAVPLRHDPIQRNELYDLSRNGHLFALVDSFYVFPEPVERVKLNPKDTDPIFFEMIAWAEVTYEPPYLVRIDPAALDWILNTLATERWGVFVISKAPIQVLQTHFQKFIIAKGPDQNPYFFKFHDGSVLEVFLRSWSPRELEVFFGPTLSFGISDLDTLEIVLWNAPQASGLKEAPKPEECLLTLRYEQLEASSGAIDRDLVKVIAWHLRNHHPRVTQFVSKETLEKRVAYGIRQGRKYRLTSLADLAGFVSLMFEIAPNFDQHPSFQRVLGNPNLPPEGKLQKLVEAVSEQDWNEAIRMYDRQFWSRALKKISPLRDR
jgi:hypothetical protein